MSDTLPSLVTLSGFLLPAVILLRRLRPRTPGHITHTLLIAMFCMFGGLLFSAALITLSGGIREPLLSSTLVLVGALACVALQQWWTVRQQRAR